MRNVKDGEVEWIEAGQMLERVSHRHTLDALRVFHAKLCDGGRLTATVTDFDSVVDHYTKGTGNPEVLMCGDNGLNRAIFNRSKLCDVLNMSGFEIVGGEHGSLKWGDGSGMLTVDARKRMRKVPEVPMKGVHAIMSLPRVAWTETLTQCIEVFTKLQVNFTKSTGVFWGQGLQRMMQALAEKSDTEYILTVDYDTIFDERDVVRLWQVMESNPDIAALCPFQIGRERKAALVNLCHKDGTPMLKVPFAHLYNEAVDIISGHFGLTLIRVSALRELPKPWFLGIPNEQGEWGENRIDDDIYFWSKMRSHGLRVCASPKVRIGHLQLVITWCKDDLSLEHQYLNQYYDDGRPQECMTY